MGVKIQDENNMPRLIRALEELQQYEVEIGILGEDNAKPSILLIASVHEFGSIKMKIPERSYMRAGFDENVRKIQEIGEMLLDGVLSLRIDARAFYEAWGAQCVSIFQEYLTDLKYPPLKPATIKRKGSSNPLIDTGRLRQSITYKVVRR